VGEIYVDTKFIALMFIFKSVLTKRGS